MKKIAKLLFLSTVITFFSSCSFIGEKNTIGSKANKLEITNGVIDIKTEIENIREQVQNIE